VHKARHDQIAVHQEELTNSMIADPAAKLCRYFGTYSEADCLPLRGSFIIDPDEKAKSRYQIPHDGLFAT